jgi:hypothetical protein
MSLDIVTVFTALRKALEPIDAYVREPIPHQLIKELGLEGRDEYLAMKAYGFPIWKEGLDYDEAYKVLGKENVDSWIENGTHSDDFHPMAHQNLDYWCDRVARKKFYEEYLEKKTSFRRMGSIGVKLHPNFTIAEIEHAMRKEQ